MFIKYIKNINKYNITNIIIYTFWKHFVLYLYRIEYNNIIYYIYIPNIYITTITIYN